MRGGRLGFAGGDSLEPLDETRDPRVNLCLGIVSEHPSGLVDVGVGDRYIAWLVGMPLDDGLFVESGFDKLDQLCERNRLRLPEIEDLKTNLALCHGDDTVHGVIDVGVVPCG